MQFTVYVLWSKNSDKIYIGFTSNMEERLISHNVYGKGYTARYRPWEVIHKENFSTKAEAISREKQLKGGQGRAWIKELIAKNFK